MSERSLRFTLGFNDRLDTAHGQVPGWVLDVPDPAVEGHMWAVEHEPLPMSAVIAIADVIDSHRRGGGRSLKSLVTQQHSQFRNDATALIRRKQALLADIAEAEQHLAAVNAALGIGEA